MNETNYIKKGWKRILVIYEQRILVTYARKRLYWEKGWKRILVTCERNRLY